MKDTPKLEARVEVLTQVIAALKDLDRETQERILTAVKVFLGLKETTDGG